jgi:hypothetical protein
VRDANARQVAAARHALAFGHPTGTPSEYIDSAAVQAWRMSEIDLEVEVEYDYGKAQSLVRAMLAAGLAERL